MSKTIIAIGLLIVLIGAILHFFPNAFSWFGNLPGDIKREGENSRFYFPITSMILISIALNILFRIFNYLK